MLRDRLVLVLSLVSAGCAATGTTVTTVPAVPAATRPAETSVVRPAVAPALEIRFEPRLEQAPSRLAVELTARGITARAWSFAAAVTGEPNELQARDGAGDLAFEQGREGQAWVVRLSRAPVGELKLRYWFDPGDISRAGAEVPAGLVLRVDRQRVLASAEEVLLLPALDPGVAIAVELGLLGAAAPVRVASTLGAPGWAGAARLGELRHAAFLIGTLGHAEFRGPEGEDDFAWSGDTAFDLRWSAAETAGARSAVDAYFNAGATRRFVGLMAVDIDFVGGGAVAVFPRGEGLYVAIAPGARWDGAARMAVAHGLVHRWIGGRLRLRGAEGEAPEAGAWFAMGFARAVAREVLYELGTLSGRDYADEVNLHMAVLATAPLRSASNAAVASAAVGGDEEARALLLARGVLYATRLDRRLLRAMLGELIAEAQQAGVGELPVEAFTRRLGAARGAEEVAHFSAAVLAGKVLTLPADALGPCFVRKPRMYTRFDLGFDERATREATPPAIRGLRAGGPAARAGLREGEPLLALALDPEDMKAPATITVQRGEREVQVTYRPSSPPVRGEGWVRRAGVSERECPP